jgi:hypothetical protein
MQRDADRSYWYMIPGSEIPFKPTPCLPCVVSAYTLEHVYGKFTTMRVLTQKYDGRCMLLLR